MVIPPGRSNKPHTIAFNSDGTLRYVELKIMNLRPPSESVQSNRWEQIGVWNSEAGHKVGPPHPAVFTNSTFGVQCLAPYLTVV